MSENKTIRIETLFPEIANLYGDHANIRYLQLCVPQAEYISDALADEPAFASVSPSMIYMGPMTEHQQELVIDKLRPYKKRIEEMIEEGVIFLITGNAMEVFYDRIENEDGSVIEGLGLFHYTAKRKMFKRYNNSVVGNFEGMKLVGFKNLFAFGYGDNSGEYFFEVEKGDGINRESKLEGIHRKNFFGTYVIGPILILNPELTLYMQKLLGVDEPRLVYEDAIRDAYEERLKQYLEHEFTLL